MWIGIQYYMSMVLRQMGLWEGKMLSGILTWWPYSSTYKKSHIGRIELSVSTASSTYELSEVTHLAPFCTYRFHSTGLCNYRGWVGLWGFLWFRAPSAKGKDHHGVSSGWSSVWHRSNTGLSSIVHNMSRSQLYLGSGHFGWLFSFFGQ